MTRFLLCIVNRGKQIPLVEKNHFAIASAGHETTITRHLRQSAPEIPLYLSLQPSQNLKRRCSCHSGTITRTTIQVRPALRTQPQTLVFTEFFLRQAKIHLLRKHGKNIHNRLRKINNIQLTALAKVLRNNIPLFLFGTQLKNNLKLFSQGIGKRLKTAITVKNNGKAHGAGEQNPSTLFSQGNGAHWRPLTDDLIARNPRIIVNTKKKTTRWYFVPPDPHTSPVHNARNGTD
ncbi:MAG: hypothetical protein V1782_13205 [Pseudomonadota bacterium]